MESNRQSLSNQHMLAAAGGGSCDDCLRNVRGCLPLAF